MNLAAPGLILELAGVLMMAGDLLSRRGSDLESPEDVRVLLHDLARATQKGLEGSVDEIKKVKDRCYAHAMDQTAELSRLAASTVKLRKLGWIGLFVIVLGSALQIAAALERK